LIQLQQPKAFLIRLWKIGILGNRFVWHDSHKREKKFIV
jgi:hypothetical protein